MWVSAILAAGGRGARMGAGVPKQMLMIDGRPILQRSFDTLASLARVAEIIVVLPSELAADPPPFLAANARVKVVDGGATRHESVAKGFALLDGRRTERVLIHDAARPLATSRLFERMMDASMDAVDAIAAMRAVDTVKQGRPGASDGSFPIIDHTLRRDSIYLAQTPQIFAYGHLAKAIALGRSAPDATDEATLVEQAGFPVSLVEGEPNNIKITTEQDLRVAETLLLKDGPVATHVASLPRIGVGYDLHRLEQGRKLVLGGVEIPHPTGLAGHSDADVLCHALTDAILGAAAQGDIGRHFPDTDPRWKDADSLRLLSSAVGIVRAAGFDILNLDAVVIAELPKLAPHVEKIRLTLARAVGIDVGAISIKGKTNEGVDALGRNEAIAVHAVALLAAAPPRSPA